MTNWYSAWPKIFLVIVLEMRGLVRPYGLRSSRSGVGISVAKAREASVSMIRFTHNIWTAYKRKMECRQKKLYNGYVTVNKLAT